MKLGFRIEADDLQASDGRIDRALSIAGGTVLLATAFRPTARAIGQLGIGLLGIGLIARGWLGGRDRGAEPAAGEERKAGAANGRREDPVVRDSRDLAEAPGETVV